MNAQSNSVSYLRFLWSLLKMSTDGSRRFYILMTALTAVALVGANAWAQQAALGMVNCHARAVV